MHAHIRHASGTRRASLLTLTLLTLAAPAASAQSGQPAPAAPAAEATPAPVTPAPQTTAESAAESAADAEALTPPWEEELLADHKVDAASIRFRPGKGLEVRSADGAFSITTKLRAQLLYGLESELDDAEQPQLSEGLQVRRARVAFSGNLFGKHNKYKLELAISPRDMSSSRTGVGISPVLDWSVTFDHLPAATIVAGQYKIPYSRQRVISSGSQQFVDRSIVQSEFNLDRDIGLDVRAGKPIADLFRYYAGIYIGEGRGAFEMTEPGLMYLGRVELLPFGGFDDYEEADFERSLRPRLSVGAAYAYLQNARRNAGILGRTPADGGTTDFHNVTGDVMFKLAGFSLQGEAFWRQGTRRPGSAVDADGNPIAPEAPRDGYGFFTQAGYLLPRTGLEVGGRYGQLRPASGASGLRAGNELGAVVSYYFAHHSLKLQADYFRLWGEQGMARGDNQVRLQLEAGF